MGVCVWVCVEGGCVGVGGCGGVSVVYVVGGSGCGWVWMDVWVCRGGWGGTGHDNVITCSEISSLKTRN